MIRRSLEQTMKTQLFALLVGFALSSVGRRGPTAAGDRYDANRHRCRHAADASTCGGIRPAEDPVG